MTETPGAHLPEEPQEERGPKGSRDTGSDQPSAGPADRPSGTADEKADTSVLTQDSGGPDSPNLQSGG
jgi:hypothetical protein